MAHFIEVYDDDGRMQIVDEPIDMTLVMKLEAKPEDDYIFRYANGSRLRYFYRDYPENDETLMAIQPSTAPSDANKSYSIKGRGNWVVGHHAGSKGIAVEGSRVTFYYYTWLPRPVKTNQNFGLEVYNESGEVSWASYNASMNILDVVKATDFRYAGGDLNNFFVKNYGHKNVAVIPIHTPRYQENNVVYDVGYTFNTAGALRLYKRVYYRLDRDEINMGINDTHGYRLEFLIVDVSNAQFLNNN